MITHSTVGRDEQSNGTSNSLCGMLPISSIPMGDLLVASRSPRCFWNCGFRFHSICLRNHKHVGDEPVVSLENGYFCFFFHVSWNCRSCFNLSFHLLDYEFAHLTKNSLFNFQIRWKCSLIIYSSLSEWVIQVQ